MTADHNESDARLGSDNPPQRRSSRAVEASRILIESSNLGLNEKLNIAEMLLPLDSETAAAMILKVIAELDEMSTVSQPPPNYQTINSVVNELFKVVDIFGNEQPDAAIDIYFHMVNTKIPAFHRMAALSRMITLESAK